MYREMQRPYHWAFDFIQNRKTLYRIRISDPIFWTVLLPNGRCRAKLPQYIYMASILCGIRPLIIKMC